MKIRKAEISDIENLSQLFDAYRVWYEKNSDLEGAVRFLSDRIEKDESVIYIAEDQFGQLLGFTQLYPLFSSTRMARLWLLNDLFVDESSRGKGISILLIEKAKELVRSTNACALCLETDKTNFIGNKLYPRTGFIMNSHSNFYEWPCS